MDAQARTGGGEVRTLAQRRANALYEITWRCGAGHITAWSIDREGSP